MYLHLDQGPRTLIAPTKPPRSAAGLTREKNDTKDHQGILMGRTVVLAQIQQQSAHMLDMMERQSRQMESWQETVITALQQKADTESTKGAAHQPDGGSHRKDDA